MGFFPNLDVKPGWLEIWTAETSLNATLPVIKPLFRDGLHPENSFIKIGGTVLKLHLSRVFEWQSGNRHTQDSCISANHTVFYPIEPQTKSDHRQH